MTENRRGVSPAAAQAIWAVYNQAMALASDAIAKGELREGMSYVSACEHPAGRLLSAWALLLERIEQESNDHRRVNVKPDSMDRLPMELRGLPADGTGQFTLRSGDGDWYWLGHSESDVALRVSATWLMEHTTPADSGPPLDLGRGLRIDKAEAQLMEARKCLDIMIYNLDALLVELYHPNEPPMDPDRIIESIESISIEIRCGRTGIRMDNWFAFHRKLLARAADALSPWILGPDGLTTPTA